MKVTTPKLIRWAGLSAVVAGIITADPSVYQYQHIHHHHFH
jgi:hypothetical protein